MNQSMTYEEFQKQVGSVILTENGNCPVTPVVQMLQGKWKLQVIYELCIQSPMRFGELKKMLKPITNTMLTNALKELEGDGLVHREQYNEIPPRVEYSLTEKGTGSAAHLLRHLPVGHEIYSLSKGLSRSSPKQQETPEWFDNRSNHSGVFKRKRYTSRSCLPP